MLTWYPFIHSIWHGCITWIYTTTDRWHDIEWLSIKSAGVTPVDVFSTVFMMLWTNGSARDCQKVVHSNVAIPLDQHAPRYRSLRLNTPWHSMPHKRKSSWTSSLWKAGPWSVWMTSGLPNRPIWLNMTDAVSTAVVNLVGNNSTHLENASMITSIYSFPRASLVSGLMWSRWRTSNGL